MTYKANVDTGDTTATEVTGAANHLVDQLAGVGLKTKHHFEVVCPALCVLASSALNADIWAAVVAHLLQRSSDGVALAECGEVECVNVGVSLLDEVESPVLVDHDDP
jgi:hypothetical protein